MDRPVFYCKSWFTAKKRPTEIWTEEHARKAHESKQHYTALIDSAERPSCTIDVTAGFVGVGFLDEHLRETLTYHFQEISSGRLFLSMATHRTYDGLSDKVASGTTYIFEESGAVRTKREYFVPEHKAETAVSKADVKNNYSSMPSFGEYSDLIRIER